MQPTTPLAGEKITTTAVTDLVQRGNTIHAEVEGSEVAPYCVSLQFDSGGTTGALYLSYDYEGWCKHIVATALTWVRQTDRIELRPTLPQLLDRLDHVQTQRLVQALEEQPELIDAVQRQVMLMSILLRQRRWLRPAVELPWM